MLTGQANFVSDAKVSLWTVRVALVLQYSYRIRKTDRWEQAILYEQGQTFAHPHEAVQVFSVDDGKSIRRQIDFGTPRPRNLATYDHLPHAKIIPQIRVTAEFSKNTWSATSIAALPPSPPGYMESKECNEMQAKRLISESWKGQAVKIDREGPETSVDATSSLPSASSHFLQTWIKNFATAANPDPTAGPRKLRLQKRDVQEGIGEYAVSLWSDSFSVGSYFIPRIEFRDMSPFCNIYSIQFSLVQSYSVIPFDEFRSGQYDPDDHQYPSETFVQYVEGNKPASNRPGKEEPTLWRGSANRRETLENGDGKNSYVWEAERVRLPDESTIRPTTLAGTKTPIRVKHKLTLKVYFSVVGETLSGEPIQGEEEGVGDLRLLMVNLPEILPSPDQ
ncbi:hypothetical protein QFC20_004934 [Naganishia adeliensis]|uniref:Uncharacterized protein n=1 Tax=Naganishia adeliensis TaxID=92952 RepID=A0ACC2VWN2_9TREE|nr:hypothetical protein QFC20_004934 [Naganishia adeliensis]